MNPKIFFMVLTLIISVIDIFICTLCIKKNDRKGLFLAVCSLFGLLICLSYTMSISLQNYTAVSVFSSIHFLSIDFLLLTFLGFISVENIDRNPTIVDRICAIAIKLYALFEIVIFTVSIFIPDFVIAYEYQNRDFVPYTYNMKGLYYAHLAYTYLLVVIILIMQAVRTLHVPREYQKKYTLVIAGIIILVGLNAGFLFLPKDNLWFQADYASLLYSFIIVVIYWAYYYYPKAGMLFQFKSQIFENIDQGIILFDIENHMLLSNQLAMKYLASAKINELTGLEEFLDRANLPVNIDEEAISLQCYTVEYGKQKPLRCDYRKLRNDKNQIIGRLFVFADAQLDTDLLTGFHSWESFRKFAIDNEKHFPIPTTAIVCDINRFAMYNTMHGRQAGDTLLKRLSEKIRKIFPEDCYYVRGQEAYLIAICYNKTEENIKKDIHQLQSEFNERIQYSVAQTSEADSTILETIHRAIDGLKAKKLTDKDSARSALLTSLVKALQECDSDTEAHVERTQKMGAELGKRLGLSDVDLSKLSLLCLLHDIGKIGVPLEVLNKPGKLTDDEWVLIKSHAVKGEAIALSTPELSGIAECIRLHHERWDGRGYPDGLSRESIPLLSRIISIVDAFDAMVNNRSYRKAKTIEFAKDEIKNCAGTQFDPVIALEFIKMLDEGFQVSVNTEDAVIPTLPTTNQTSIETQTISKAIHPMIYAKYTLNTKDQIVSIDKSFTELTGFTMDDIKERSMTQWDLLPKEDRTDYICIVTEQMANNPMAYLEHRIVCKDGSIKYVYCMGKKYFDSVAREEKVEIIVANAASTYSSKLLSTSMEKKAERQLQQWEKTYRKDSLTGLLTHNAFVSDVEQTRLKNPEKDVLVAMIDVDNFKQYNDSYGHHEGDEFLILLSQAIIESIGNSDLAARMGGDEFMIASFVNKNSNYKDYAVKIFHSISAKLSSLEKSTSFSMGVALMSDNLNTFNKLYEASDKVLYKSKDAGRNRVTFFEESEE